MTDEKHETLRTEVVTHTVQVIDDFLFGTIMLIFAFGLYEIFISRIDPAMTGLGKRLLQIHNLDDLKDRLSTVILFDTAKVCLGPFFHFPVVNL